VNLVIAFQDIVDDVVSVVGYRIVLRRETGQFGLNSREIEAFLRCCLNQALRPAAAEIELMPTKNGGCSG